MRRRILSVVGVGSAAAMFFAIAPNADEPSRAPSTAFAGDTAVEAARAELRARTDSVVALQRALERAVAVDAARAATRTSATTTFRADPLLPEGVRARFAEVATAELAGFQSPKVPVHVLVLAVDGAGVGYARRVVLPSAPGDPCVSVVLIDPDLAHSRPADNDRLVGTCGFYARYGMPGRGVLGWIDSLSTSAFVLDVTPPLHTGEMRQRYRFVGGYVALGAAPAACLAHRDDACGQAFAGYDRMSGGTRDVTMRSDAGPRVLRASAFAAYWRQSSYMARLRDHVGDASFERIWTSDLALPQAYEQVMGEPFAAFVRPLLLEEIEPHKPGPLHAELPLALALSCGALCAAWAVIRTRRERS